MKCCNCSKLSKQSQFHPGNFLQEALAVPNQFCFFSYFKRAELCEILEAQRCILLSSIRCSLSPEK